MGDIKVTWEQINKVREATSLGMWDAREVLFVTKGNVEEAIELINYYKFNDWELRYKLMTIEKGIKSLEKFFKGKKNEL